MGVFIIYSGISYCMDISEQMVTEFCLPDQYQLVGVSIGRDINPDDSFVNSKLANNQGCQENSCGCFAL